METFSARESTGHLWFPPHKRPITRSFDVFFGVSLNKQLKTVELPGIWDALALMWRHRNGYQLWHRSRVSCVPRVVVKDWLSSIFNLLRVFLFCFVLSCFENHRSIVSPIWVGNYKLRPRSRFSGSSIMLWKQTLLNFRVCYWKVTNKPASSVCQYEVKILNSQNLLLPLASA